MQKQRLWIQRMRFFIRKAKSLIVQLRFGCGSLTQIRLGLHHEDNVEQGSSTFGCALLFKQALVRHGRFKRNGQPNARSLALFHRNAQRSSTELAFQAIAAISIVAQQPFGPPCSKSHVLRHFEASGHRIICSKQAH